MIRIAFAKGDGIGPEISDVVLKVFKAAKVDLEFDFIDIGEALYLRGISSGIDDKAWSIIKQNKILLKGPITTPLGKGYKSLNVTFRKTLGLYANIRPVMSYSPFIEGPIMDMVVIRENEEDLYAGIEYMPTFDTYLSFKLISHQGCEKIIRYAFEYARHNQRKKVTCITKNNIMKITDGAFANIFYEIAQDYTEIEANHMIVDIGAARIATRPKSFDVVVSLNLYGDILSDIAAETSGALGLAGSANIGTKYAMFEAVHGSAPDIAGQNKANPSGLLNAAIFMLRHLNMNDKANIIQNAWLTTIEKGLHTSDIFCQERSTKLLLTDAFGEAIINNLGQKPSKLQGIEEKAQNNEQSSPSFKGQRGNRVVEQKDNDNNEGTLYGCDIYVESSLKPTSIAELVQEIISNTNCELKGIAQRGLMVWPKCETELTDVTLSQLRFQGVNKADLINLQERIDQQGLRVVLVSYLHNYDSIIGFTKMQGE